MVYGVEAMNNKRLDRAKLSNLFEISNKIHIFSTFLSKYLVISKKSSTFAPAFEWKCAFCATTK